MLVLAVATPHSCRDLFNVDMALEYESRPHCHGLLSLVSKSEPQRHVPEDEDATYHLLMPAATGICLKTPQQAGASSRRTNYGPAADRPICAAASFTWATRATHDVATLPRCLFTLTLLKMHPADCS